MFADFVRFLSILLWSVVVGTIVYGAAHACWILICSGNKGLDAARRTVAAAIVNALTVTTAIALLASTQLRSWSAIGIFVAAAALRTFVKFFETHILAR